MKRLAPVGGPRRTDPLDLVVVLALAVVPAAYYLGRGIDWTSLDRFALAESQSEPDSASLGGLPAESGPLAAGMRRAIGALAAPPREAAPAASPESDPYEQASWDDMVGRLYTEAMRYDGRVGIYLKDLKRNRVWAHNAEDLFPSASLVKVPIMIAVFDRINKGELTLQSVMSLRRRHRVGGSGSLKWQRDGTKLTVRQTVEKMIDESDNTAMRMLIEAVGFGFIQQHFSSLGLLYTEIYPEGLSLKSGRVSAENYTTAREMSMLLEKIYRGEMVDRYSSELMLDIMKRQKSRARLAKGLPAGWEIAHKTGLLRQACHDSAVIFTPQGDYVLTVLTGQNKSYGRAKDFITRLGVITYRHYRGGWSSYARARREARRSRSPDYDALFRAEVD